MHNCDYCGDLKLVGGTMPNYTFSVLPCAYCDQQEVDPEMPIHLHTIDGRKKPWPAAVMSHRPFVAKHLGFTSYVEPFIQGQRLIVVVSPKHRVDLWTPAGVEKDGNWPLVCLTGDLARLAIGLHWVGGAEYAKGCVFDGVLQVEQELFHIHTVMPTVKLIDGRDHTPLGVRRKELSAAWEESSIAVEPSKWGKRFVCQVPHIQLTTSPVIGEKRLADFAQELGADKLMVKDNHETWKGGPSYAWMKWENEL